MSTPESREKDKICKYLRCGKPIMWFFRAFMGGFGKRGVPDIVGVYRTKMFAIEVKRYGKDPTPIQQLRMSEIEAAGGKTFWGTAEKVIAEFEKWIDG